MTTIHEMSNQGNVMKMSQIINIVWECFHLICTLKIAICVVNESKK